MHSMMLLQPAEQLNPHMAIILIMGELRDAHHHAFPSCFLIWSQ
ncbi:hypothetical protein NSU_0310 [Novosphingobium pentaromativorans US6-1]|uniref:Uncharacterized protein n=1 Tax=Novosphingobium pentaromativorans US6-1 TaxID=1088721 RepID=G6E7H5_9SPHN|nr:hypothetical protein NSU_0310 [Novosphingobium pentaromativorans US6-1]